MFQPLHEPDKNRVGFFDRVICMLRNRFRDHGDTHHLNRGLFHSCLLDEAIGAVREFARMHPLAPRVLVGFSLGGNFALRVALHGPRAGLQLDGAVAVFDVADNNTLHRILNEWADIVPAQFETDPLVDLDSAQRVLAGQVAAKKDSP